MFYNDGVEGFGLDGGIDKCADIIHAAYKAALNYNIEANGSEFCGGQPLPFTMELRLVGIGGFEFGQLIACEFIPAAIQKNFYYQIIAIEQFFRGDGWYTTLVTIPRTKTKSAAAGTGGGWNTYHADEFLKKQKDYKEQVIQVTGGATQGTVNGIGGSTDKKDYIGPKYEQTGENEIKPIPTVENTGGNLIAPVFDENGNPITKN